MMMYDVVSITTVSYQANRTHSNIVVNVGANSELLLHLADVASLQGFVCMKSGTVHGRDVGKNTSHICPLKLARSAPS